MIRRLSPTVCIQLGPGFITVAGNGWYVQARRQPGPGRKVVVTANGKAPTGARPFWRKRLGKLLEAREWDNQVSDAQILEDAAKLCTAFEAPLGTDNNPQNEE